MNVKNLKVFDVWQGKDVEGQGIVVWKRHNGPNQRWTIVYVDESPKEPTSGLYKPFGFYINRPFLIESRLPMRRVLEVVGARNIVIRSKVYKRREQQFVFDMKTKTIKSVPYMDRSFDIQNAGRSQNLQVWKTNARWF